MQSPDEITEGLKLFLLYQGQLLQLVGVFAVVRQIVIVHIDTPDWGHQVVPCASESDNPGRIGL